MQGSVQEVGSVHWVCCGAGGEQGDEGDATMKYLTPKEPDFCCLPLGMMQPAKSKCRDYKSSAARLCVPCPTTKHCTRDRARGEIQVLLYSFMTS